MSEEVRNAAERLRKLLRAAQYPQLSTLRLEAGDVSDLLRVLHFILLDSSRAVAQFLVDKGYDLYGKTDARFVESAFRLLRDEFRCFPSLSVTQFLARQFVARRLAIVADAAAAVSQKRQELQRQKRREEAVWSQPHERRREVKPMVENHVLPTPVVNHAASILQHLKLQPAETPRRASSDAPVQNNEVKLEEQATAPPAPISTGRQVNIVRFASENGAVGEADHAVDGLQTGNRPPPLQEPCSCSQDQVKLVKAIGDISRQLSEMSNTLVGKISTVETRLGRLENQMHDVRVAVEEQRELVSLRANATHIGRMTANLSARGDGELPKAVDLTDKRRSLDVESPCAWPPQPSVFERY